MGILSRIADRFAKQIAERISGQSLQVTPFQAGRVYYPDEDYKSLIARYNGYVYVCASKNAISCAQVPLHLYASKPSSTAKSRYPSRKVKSQAMRAGECFTENGVLVQVLHPPRDGAIRSSNDNCVVLRIDFGRFSALLTGDLERSGETEILSRWPHISGLLLKVAHHGSRSGTQDLFLDRARPSWALISAGRNNPFGHPTAEVVNRLLRHGIRPLLTVDQGAISLTTDGIGYLLHSYRGGLLEKGILPDPACPQSHRDRPAHQEADILLTGGSFPAATP